jgi:hypothetical protein
VVVRATVEYETTTDQENEMSEHEPESVNEGPRRLRFVVVAIGVLALMIYAGMLLRDEPSWLTAGMLWPFVLLAALYIGSLRWSALRIRMSSFDRFVVGAAVVFGGYALFGGFLFGADQYGWSLGPSHVLGGALLGVGVATLVGRGRTRDASALDLLRQPMVVVVLVCGAAAAAIAVVDSGVDRQQLDAASTSVPQLVLDEGRVVLGETTMTVSQDGRFRDLNPARSASFFDEPSVRSGRAEPDGQGPAGAVVPTYLSSGSGPVAPVRDRLRTRLLSSDEGLTLTLRAQGRALGVIPDRIEVFTGACGAVQRESLEQVELRETSSSTPRIRVFEATLQTSLDDLTIARPLSLEFQPRGTDAQVCADTMNRHAVLVAQGGEQAFQQDCVDSLELREDEREALQVESFSDAKCRSRAKALLARDASVIVRGATSSVSRDAARELSDCIVKEGGSRYEPFASGDMWIVPVLPREAGPLLEGEAVCRAVLNSVEYAYSFGGSGGFSGSRAPE